MFGLLSENAFDFESFVGWLNQRVIKKREDVRGKKSINEIVE